MYFPNAVDSGLPSAWPTTSRWLIELYHVATIQAHIMSIILVRSVPSNTARQERARGGAAVDKKQPGHFESAVPERSARKLAWRNFTSDSRRLSVRYIHTLTVSILQIVFHRNAMCSLSWRSPVPQCCRATPRRRCQVLLQDPQQASSHQDYSKCTAQECQGRTSSPARRRGTDMSACQCPES